MLRRRDLFSETYCGGYSGEDPPLPIPNREVKLTIADGTAPPGGRVGSCHFLIRDPDITRCRGLLSYLAALWGSGSKVGTKSTGDKVQYCIIAL